MVKEALEGEEPEVKKKKSGKLLIIIIVLLIFGGGGGAAWHFFLADMFHKHFNANEASSAAVGPAAKSAPPMGKVVALPTFRVNLADPLGKKFIKLVVEIEVVSDPVVEELNSRQAAVRDSIILLLSSKSYADIASMESKLVLKSEITDRVNQILGGPKVVQVYFTDMVIQ